jgi:hypothetical protein
MTVARTPQAVHSGFYSPIQSEPGREMKAMPVFYGMMLANQFAGARMLRADYDLAGANATVYAARREPQTLIAVFNKDQTTPIQLSIRGSLNASAGTVWRMQAPSLDATERVTLAGAEILLHAQWSPHAAELLEVKNGVARLRIPNSSAALLILK